MHGGKSSRLAADVRLPSGWCVSRSRSEPPVETSRTGRDHRPFATRRGDFVRLAGAPGRIRTCDARFRSLAGRVALSARSAQRLVRAMRPGQAGSRVLHTRFRCRDGQLDGQPSGRVHVRLGGGSGERDARADGQVSASRLIFPPIQRLSGRSRNRASPRRPARPARAWRAADQHRREIAHLTGWATRHWPLLVGFDGTYSTVSTAGSGQP